MKMNKRDPWEYIAFVAIGMGIFGVVFSVASLFEYPPSFFSQDAEISKEKVPSGSSSASKPNHLSVATFTAFDRELAKQFMDKDGDGKCDICGMDIDMCMSSGMLQCSGMDPDATIGLLGSQHIHADWKVYINGKDLDFEGKDHMGRMKSNLPVSSFIHVDSGAPAPEKTGDILHMHAEGVPLWIFFQSLSMNFTQECFVLDTGEEYCNTEEKQLKFYVNGVENTEFEDYIFKDNDKLLVTYGAESEEEIEEQVKTVTDFAKNH